MTFTILAVMAIIAVLDAAIPFSKMFNRDQELLGKRRLAHKDVE